MDIEKQISIINDSRIFDESWYREKYRDVGLLEMDPLAHFVKYSRLLRRSPSEAFDTGFYLDRYLDAEESPLCPLVHYALHGQAEKRPTTRIELRAAMAALRNRMNGEWQVDRIPSSRSAPPIISYCIPLMGRLEDLQGTLRANLESHISLRDSVEFLIVLFGPSDDTIKWIDDGFKNFMEDGFLRVITDNSLDSWHFGKAKNSFKPHMLGELYSSLDGDNFVTIDETKCILENHSQYDGHFLLHHFSGQWGDGTSGRITLPAEVYRAIGYNPKMLPRQFDEIDFILSALKKFPAMPLLCIDINNNLFKKSGHAKNFRSIEMLQNKIVAVSRYERRPPLNPRGDDYTIASPHLRVMGDFNANYSGFCNSTSPIEKNKYYNKLISDRHKLIDILPIDRIIDTIFLKNDRPYVPYMGTDDISLLICVHNEDNFLKYIIPHYRSLGVNRFFIVDDGSDVPVSEIIRDTDVHVFRPKVGDFRAAKGLWLEALIKVYLPEGNWLLAVDADEFIQLPRGFKSFRELADNLEAQDTEYCAGLMLDMLPAPETAVSALQRAETDFASLFTHCCNMPGRPTSEYSEHRSIAWGFGPHAEISWRVDARYHAFGTYDSLRKMPFLRHRPHRHLNQGFHSLHYTDGTPSPSDTIWEKRPILPVFHYKLMRIYLESAREKMLKLADSYHARTGSNIQQIFGGDGQGAIAALERLAPYSVPVEQMIDLLDQPAPKN